MADTFKFELVSPERLLMSEDVVSVIVAGSEGDFQVFAKHAPIMSTLRQGLLTIDNGDGSLKRMFVRGGTAEGGPEYLTVLAEHAIDLQSVSRGELEEQMKKLEEDAGNSDDDKFKGDAAMAVEELRQIASSLS